jgi:hypothetical protein
MTTVLLPDTEQLVINALLGMAELSSLGGRIYGVTPKNRTFPLARVSRFGGDPLWGGEPYWVDSVMLQFDIWANSGFVEAYSLAEQMRSCVATLTGAWPEGVVVSARVTALVATSDPDFDPPKPRYRFTATLLTHPRPTPAASWGDSTAEWADATATWG